MRGSNAERGASAHEDETRRRIEGAIAERATRLRSDLSPGCWIVVPLPLSESGRIVGSLVEAAGFPVATLFEDFIRIEAPGFAPWRIPRDPPSRWRRSVFGSDERRRAS